MNAYRFFRHIYADNAQRRERKRNIRGDLALWLRNRAAMPLEQLLIARYRPRTHNLVFILGVPRSGTTLLYQLVARHLRVGYVSNAAARYWMAPIYGTWRTDTPREPQARTFPLQSKLGSSEGWQAPHEFAYFWHYFAGFFESDDLSQAELDRFRWGAIRRELQGLSGYFDAPVVLKALNHCSYNAQRFAQELGDVRFLHITREPCFAAQSILLSREMRYGDTRSWWSLRPRDFRNWAHASPVEQVCHQVRDVDRGIRQALSAVGAERCLTLSYEDLVAHPALTLGRVARHIGVNEPTSSNSPNQAELSLGNTWRLDLQTRAEVERCLRI